ncbi:MAG TPA: pyruvate kinase [Patescibacteria group bacterium]|jgi:pyruvate kinase|nr:pyruvate kinase [Patescibacteria group bacterium]
MNLTEQAPRVPINEFKRTKIIATVGPATDSYEKIYDLIAAGANGLRLNFSHCAYDMCNRQIPWIRKASSALDKPVAIIQDLQGPKVRLGDFEGVISVKAGDSLIFDYNTESLDGGRIPIQYDISKKIQVGERLYVYDGRVQFDVKKVHDGLVYATAKNDGWFTKRKGLNLPDTDFGGDILTEKDMADIAYGAKQDIDYVAISFVQTSKDIDNFRRVLKQHNQSAKIIAKIETKVAVDNIETIIQATDVTMVARGDLAVETPAESVPVVQRLIINLGLKYAKPTIVATQMLMSMVEMQEPTRAEVSDVATAVFLGADSVMLSEETAMGKYPIETVKIMKRIILYSETHTLPKIVLPMDRERSIQNAISSGIISMAEDIGAKTIIAETKSGTTALQVAARRPETAIIAVTDEARTAQQLAIAYGVKSFIRPTDSEAAVKFTDWLLQNSILSKGDVVVTVSGRHPGVVGTTDTIKVRVLE